MYDLKAFRQRVQELTRRSFPNLEGQRATQRDLAEAIGLHATELSKRLNGAKDAHLSDRDVRAIVLTFAEWGAITTQAEALALLELAACSPFSANEWQQPPLDELTATSTSLASAQTSNLKPQRSNLPRQQTSFIGRGGEMQEVEMLLGQTRLLTITGAGGAGKTRFALELTAHIRLPFADGVWLVELAALGDGELVAQAVARVMGVRERSGVSLSATLTQALADKELLLLLDNCEHLVDAVAGLCSALLPRCPRLRIVATSREALRVDGETVWRLPSLSLPPAHSMPSLQSLAHYEAVRLFVERAKAAHPDFALSADNAAAVHEICQRLDGIPLALELAAALVRTMSVAQICASLDDRFALLKAEQTHLPRQQTLAALIDWSYDLLTASEQALFASLAAFAGGFSLEAAETICAEQRGGGLRVILGLGQLVEKSLLAKERQGENTRYRMLETIREYAAQRLRGSEREAHYRRQHAEYYLSLAEVAAAELSGSRQASWLAWFDVEQDNLWAALTWTKGQGESGMLLRLALALHRFWMLRGLVSEGRLWLAAALEDNTADPYLRARALISAGDLSHWQGDYSTAAVLVAQGLVLASALHDDDAVAAALKAQGTIARNQNDFATAQQKYEAALQLFRHLGDDWNVATALSNLAAVAVHHLDYPLAQRLLEESLTIHRGLGDQNMVAIALYNLADINMDLGDYAASRALLLESEAIYKQLTDDWNLGWVYNNLAEVAASEGDYAAAKRWLAESLPRLQAVGDKWAIARAYYLKGWVAMAGGDYVAARTLLHAALDIWQAINAQRMIANLVELLAEIRLAEGKARAATRLLAAAERLREAISAAPTPIRQQAQARLVGKIQAKIDEPTFAAAWQEGREAPLDELFTIALAHPKP